MVEGKEDESLILKLAVERGWAGVPVSIQNRLKPGSGGGLISSERGQGGAFVRIGLQVEELAGAVEFVVMVEGKFIHGEFGPLGR